MCSSGWSKRTASVLFPCSLFVLESTQHTTGDMTLHWKTPHNTPTVLEDKYRPRSSLQCSLFESITAGWQRVHCYWAEVVVLCVPTGRLWEEGRKTAEPSWAKPYTNKTKSYTDNTSITGLYFDVHVYKHQCFWIHKVFKGVSLSSCQSNIN